MKTLWLSVDGDVLKREISSTKAGCIFIYLYLPRYKCIL